MKMILAAIALLMATLAAAQEAPQRLIGYWPLDEAEGTAALDASGAGRNGEILNESKGVTRVAGRTGGALEFRGGDPAKRGEAGAVALKGLDKVDWAAGLTVETWVNFTALDRPQTYELVSNSKDDRGPGFRFVLSWASLWLRSGEGGGGATWGAQTDASAIAFKTGQWYHLAGTYDGSVFRVYVDGILAGQSDPGLTLQAGEPAVYLGSYHAGYAYGLNAIMDEVRLYNYARSAADLALDAKLRD